MVWSSFKLAGKSQAREKQGSNEQHLVSTGRPRVEVHFQIWSRNGMESSADQCYCCIASHNIASLVGLKVGLTCLLSILVIAWPMWVPGIASVHCFVLMLIKRLDTPHRVRFPLISYHITKSYY